MKAMLPPNRRSHFSVIIHMVWTTLLLMYTSPHGR
jgi:hypothetical protein